MHNEIFRSFRRTQLSGIGRSDPLQILNQYRTLFGRDARELPQDLSMNDMIEAILDREEADSLSSGVLRAIAS